MSKVAHWLKLTRSMGMRYVSFRLLYEVKRKTHLLKRSFPENPVFQKWITLEEWRKSAAPFFFASREALQSSDASVDNLKNDAERILKGEIQFFQGEWKAIDNDSWLTNPVTGYVYDGSKHWTEIPDFHPAYGDIKYVWEKSRFTFLQTIFRYDLHYAADSSQWVFRQIESWINHNPINCGPNYRCSQEISLRIFNWIYALYFYRYSPNLNEELFNKILFHIYWQARHVRANIDFSRIAVRNNHAITETLALYSFGLLFPFFREASEWKSSGKKWFEQEIAYQIYEDGGFLQFSNNYHRVVIQLLSWAISLADVHGEKFSDVVYRRSHASVNLLMHCQDKISGQLPNYGANDGALFFKWSDHTFRDYRPALDTLHFLLTGQGAYFGQHDDRQWFGVTRGVRGEPKIHVTDGNFSFHHGGLYVFRRHSMLLVINCVSYKDRPQQADSLHLDLWFDGQNILWDAGSYRYNTNAELVKYFFGTESHNTVMLGHNDQMLKAGRFIWLGWSDRISAGWEVNGSSVKFSGIVKAFNYLGKISHRRSVTISDSVITVSDTVSGKNGLPLRQLWHLNPSVEDRVTIQPRSGSDPFEVIRSEKYYSPTYGVLEKSNQLEFVSKQSTITTEIILK
jgi:hypothetical protein